MYFSPLIKEEETKIIRKLEKMSGINGKVCV